MPIRILSDVVAAQIAAGEVIERPASVVKELVENALDAGATRIQVDVEGSGLALLRITDDGVGIPAEEAPLALVRHATSKLSSVQDLNEMQTLGFRGEALASIASVSQFSLTTRNNDASTAIRLISEGGQMVDERKVGAPVGTTIEVANLFYNVPARRKFLKSDSTERRHITNFIMRYAMAYPLVRFALYMDGKEAFRTSGSGDLGEVILDTLGLEVFREMLEVTSAPNHRPDLPPIRVSGYTSNPNQTRANRGQITLFVNGRSIQDQRLTYAVAQAYHTLIPQGRYPVSVLMIELAPSEVDVNVHPAKAEVRFRSPDAVFSAVGRAVRDTVTDNKPIRPVSAAQYVAWASPEDDLMAPPSGEIAPRIVQPEQLGLGLDSPDRGRRPNQQAPQWEEEADLEHIPVGAGTPTRPRNLPPMRVVGQVGATYIVAEGPSGLYLVDQHAAHERILYEQFMARHAAAPPTIQHTLESTVVELAPLSARLLEENIGLLEELGFALEPFGVHAFRVRALPAALADQHPADVLHRVMDDLENNAAPGAKTIEEKILRRVCKTAAVKAGQVLSYDEMQGLLRQLERCEHPLTCPHGRPTLIHMSAADLAREFGRT